MASIKEQMIRIIEEQPDDSSFHEILRELAFAQMVERGLADSDERRTISNEEMKRRVRSWQK
ncbi:MAG: hypothetical protein ACE5IY_21100 [bacterium]